MGQISVELDKINTFIRSFRAMEKRCDREFNAQNQICVAITVNRDTNVRRYNDATRTDVVSIFTAVDGEPSHVRNMISFHRQMV